MNRAPLKYAAVKCSFFQNVSFDMDLMLLAPLKKLKNDNGKIPQNKMKCNT